MKNLTTDEPKRRTAPLTKSRRRLSLPLDESGQPDVMELTGLVCDIHLHQGAVTIKPARARSVRTFRWKPETVVLRNNFPYGRDTLRPGEKVTVSYELNRGLPVLNSVNVDPTEARPDLGSPDFPNGKRAPRGGRHHRAARLP